MDLSAALRDARDTRRIHLAAGAHAAFGAIFAELVPNRPAVVIADANTWPIAGQEVVAGLARAGVTRHASMVMPAAGRTRAAWERLLEIEHLLISNQAVPVAVGGGTLAELVKLAAHRHARPCAVVATAASTTAFAAAGAAVLRDGCVQSCDCAAPLLVAADPAVVAAAPPILAAAGAAELAAEATAGADALLADALGLEPFDQRAADLAWPDPSGDRLSALLGCGLATQVRRPARPASGAARQIARLWVHDGVPHAAALAVASLVAAALYERLLAEGPEVDVPARCAAWPAWAEVEAEAAAQSAVPALRAIILAEARARHLAADALAARLRLLADRWGDLRRRLVQRQVPVRELRTRLESAGAPTTLAAIGRASAALRTVPARARRLGGGYGILDLAVELGAAERWLARPRI